MRVLAAAVFAVVCGTIGVGEVAAQTATVTLTDDVVVGNVKRLGINLGGRNRWGDAQILKNLIDNPGFEAGEYGSVVLADSGSTGTIFRQAFISSTAQPDGFWTGAEYEIVWGAAKGRRGTIRSFARRNGRYEFELEPGGAVPGYLDVMLVRRSLASNPHGLPADTARRPGSPGRQSAVLGAPATRFDFFMDSYWRDGDRSAGKLLPVRGRWRAEVWARGAEGGEELRVQFLREGTTPFIDQRVQLSTEWRAYTFDADVPADADPLREYGPGEYRPILDFRVEVTGNARRANIDDVALYRIDDTNRTIFTDAFVDRLRELRPGIVRNWSGQLGASLDAELQSPWGRPVHGSRSDNAVPGAYNYGLHDFLELAELLGAEPWYVVPPTFSEAELKNLIEYLAAPAGAGHPYADVRAARGRSEPWTSTFRRIHLEYGNELWGSARTDDPFQGASVNGGVRLGAIASDRFAIMKTSTFFSPEKFNLIIGGQAGYSGRQREIQLNASQHDAVALAPYFGILQTFADDAEIFGPLLATPFYETSASGNVRQSYDHIRQGTAGRNLAIYEINFHTTSGPAPIGIRNDFLTGMAGGLALPLIMLTYQHEFGAVDQCAFSTLGYSFRIATDEYARVWGMLRDLYATGRKRPTWLGVELANRAIAGNAVQATVSGGGSWSQAAINGIGAPTVVGNVQAFAFAEGARRSVVLFNLSLTSPQTAELTLPRIPKGIAALHRLGAASIHSDNEDSLSVTIATDAITDFRQGYRMELPPHSMSVVQWEDASVTGVEDMERAGLILQAPAVMRNGDRVSFAAEAAGARLELCDMLGNVSLLASESPGGSRSVRIDAAGPLSAGVYVLRVVAGGKTLVQKVMVAE